MCERWGFGEEKKGGFGGGGGGGGGEATNTPDVIVSNKTCCSAYSLCRYFIEGFRVSFISASLGLELY